MYLIKLEHIGKDLDYTKEEQSASSDSWKWIKYKRMAFRWLCIICPYIDANRFCDELDNNNIKLDDNRELDDKMMYSSHCIVKYIQNYLNFLNSQDGGNRKFSIEIIERKPIELELDDDDDDDDSEDRYLILDDGERLYFNFT